MLIGLGGVYLVQRGEGRHSFADNFCPTDAQIKDEIVSPGHTAILVDTSNKIAPDDVDKVLEMIEIWVKKDEYVPNLQMLSVFNVPGSTAPMPRESGRSLCVPREGEETTGMFVDRRVVQKHFENFLESLKEVLDKPIKETEADQSPIVETMAHLVERFEKTGHPLDAFVIVSDMLQNSGVANLYAGDAELTDDARQYCKRVTDSRSKVNYVAVYYIDRELDEQGNLWPDDSEWWKECLGDVEGLRFRDVEKWDLGPRKRAEP